MGRPGLAFSSDLKEEIAWFSGLLKAMLNAEKDSWASTGRNGQMVRICIDHERDAAVLRITGEASQLINSDLADLREYVHKLGKYKELQVIIDIYKELSLLNGLLWFNLNKSLTWQLYCLHC